MAAIQSFVFVPSKSRAQSRFDEFIVWARPGGRGGFNQVHVERYEADEPFFTYSSRFIAHSHCSERSWLIKQEQDLKGGTRSFYSRAVGDEVPVVTKPEVMIPPGRFLRFAKAYLNVYTALRDLSSPSKSTVRALIYMERALRDLNGGDNDPAHICHLTFKRAALMLQRSKLVPAVKFDVGKSLEHMAKLLQAGGKFKGAKNNKLLPAFNIIKTPFVFHSPIKSPPKFGKARGDARPDSESDAALQARNLSGEEVAAVGMAYRRALDRFGPEGAPTFYAALTGLPLTTASMRASELQILRDDAIYQDGDRPRLRVPRPKIGLEQDVPIPKKLGPLAHELFNIIKNHSAEARKALAFYIKQSPVSQEGVHTLYIPDRLKEIFKKPYLDAADARAIINPDLATDGFPLSLNDLERTTFVKQPGDWQGNKNPHPMVQVKDVIRLCRRLPVELKLPERLLPHYFISRKDLNSYCRGYRIQDVEEAFDALFASEKALATRPFLRRDDVIKFLLDDFKKLGFPHWPYADKGRSVRLDRALALHHRPNNDMNADPGDQLQLWWLPCLLSIQALNHWIGHKADRPPLLFALTDVRLDNGSYPTISVHKTRRHHHTTALAAGANPQLLNQLAGRQSSWQADAYDCRTPGQILRQSMDTFDPNAEFDVIGPIADEAPPSIKVTERRIFLMENAAPKHIHETGGCSSDWSLDPCHRFGDCMRCEKDLWRKGDVGRLPRIHAIKAESSRIVQVGGAKLLKNPRLVSVANHVRQARETIARCDEILRIEMDDSISVGTIVTFGPADSAMSDAELLSWLRKQQRQSGASGASA
ncbi:MAG: hypothetical protein HY020_06900 [Burkholderiales bacterium]|nr:hypothetical protein [Burkholderiales bacterium]